MFCPLTSFMRPLVLSPFCLTFLLKQFTNHKNSHLYQSFLKHAIVLQIQPGTCMDDLFKEMYQNHVFLKPALYDTILFQIFTSFSSFSGDLWKEVILDLDTLINSYHWWHVGNNLCHNYHRYHHLHPLSENVRLSSAVNLIINCSIPASLTLKFINEIFCRNKNPPDIFTLLVIKSEACKLQHKFSGLISRHWSIIVWIFVPKNSSFDKQYMCTMYFDCLKNNKA